MEQGITEIPSSWGGFVQGTGSVESACGTQSETYYYSHIPGSVKVYRRVCSAQYERDSMHSPTTPSFPETVDDTVTFGNTLSEVRWITPVWGKSRVTRALPGRSEMGGRGMLVTCSTRRRSDAHVNYAHSLGMLRARAGVTCGFSLYG